MATSARYRRDPVRVLSRNQAVPRPLDHFVLTLWTDDPRLAAAADKAGVDRVGLDLERLGKAARQRGLGTWISTHRVEQLAAVRDSLRDARVFVRTDPLSEHSADEVELLLEYGAQVLMLPMFRSADEVARFISLVGGRATVVPLLETTAAAETIAELVRVEGLGEIHVGLNDLALSLRVRNRFEVLNSHLLLRVAEETRAAGLRLGIGALGRLNGTTGPVTPDLLYARYVDLGASAALLARSYLLGLDVEALPLAISATRERIAWWHAAGPAAREQAHRQLRLAVRSAPGW